MQIHTPGPRGQWRDIGHWAVAQAAHPGPDPGGTRMAAVEQHAVFRALTGELLKHQPGRDVLTTARNNSRCRESKANGVRRSGLRSLPGNTSPSDSQTAAHN